MSILVEPIEQRKDGVRFIPMFERLDKEREKLMTDDPEPCGRLEAANGRASIF